MRRSAKQDLLLAVCSKMGEVIPLLTDNECDTCVNFLKEIHANATQTVDAVASPAFQNLSLRELFDEKAIVKPGLEKEKKAAKKPKPSLSPREPSKRRARKRALWSDNDGDDGEDEAGDAEFKSSPKKAVKPKKASQEKKTVKPKKVMQKKADKGKKDKVEGVIAKWDPQKHKVIVGVSSFDKERDAMVVEAKVSTHFRAKTNLVYVTPKDVDKVMQKYWPNMASYFADHEMPVSFEGTRFASFCVNHNKK